MTVPRLICRSPAKINLHLEVLGRRGDGFHELRTLFQTIDLADRLVVTLGQESGAFGVDLVVRGLTAAAVSAGPENLATRAALAFAEAFGLDRRVHLDLDKRVPVGGGLGGGSANAATVLLALRALTGRPAELGELLPLAAKLGADVPYFLVGGTAWGSGRGDEIVPTPELPQRALWLVVPAVGAATAAVFRALGAAPQVGTGDPRVPLALGEQQPWLALARVARNDLEAPAVATYPEIGAVRERCLRAGGDRVWMSGSGSTLVVDADRHFAARWARTSGPTATLHHVRTLSRRRLARWSGLAAAAGTGLS
jgi:4-diphosphocytidyl-2-C-methyl-D-erythritol kinase